MPVRPPHSIIARSAQVVAISAIAGVVLGALGCYQSKITQPTNVQSATGARLDDVSSLRPDASPGDRALLKIDGLDVPVKVSMESQGEMVILKLWAHDQVFEEEHYQSKKEGFGLVNAAGELYKPEIPLLKFPMKIGDEWSWKGQMVTGPIGRKAEAKIRTGDDRIYVGPEPVATLRVEVELSMDSGGPNPAKRRLVFWFAKERGVIRREFGVSTSREPVPQAP